MKRKCEYLQDMFLYSSSVKTELKALFSQIPQSELLLNKAKVFFFKKKTEYNLLLLIIQDFIYIPDCLCTFNEYILPRFKQYTTLSYTMYITTLYNTTEIAIRTLDVLPHIMLLSSCFNNITVAPAVQKMCFHRYHKEVAR